MALLLGGCSDEIQCLAACGPLTLSIPYPSDADPATARVEVCLNSACSEGPMPTQGEPSALVGDLGQTTVLAVRMNNAGPLELRIEMYLGNKAQLAAGDGYSVVVRDADGVVIAQKTWSAAGYSEHELCGEMCVGPMLTE